MFQLALSVAIPNKEIKGFRLILQRNQLFDRVVVLAKESCGPMNRWMWQCRVHVYSLKGEMSVNKAADIHMHGVPCLILKDCLSGTVVDSANPGPQPYLTWNDEMELPTLSLLGIIT